MPQLKRTKKVGPRDARPLNDGPRGEQLFPLAHGSLTKQPLLLKSKLRIPRPRPNLVPRPHLVHKLNSALQRPLTSVSAPAGFGKTILLTEWAAQNTCLMAWVSLDPNDNSPIQFWAYLTAAIHQISHTRGEGPLFLLQPLDERHTELFLSALLNQVTDLTEETVIILDDYHLIESSLIHAGMTFLIEHLPPQLHIVIASRAVPPVATARLRAGAQLLELTQEDLEFTDDEASEFFQRAGIQNLSSQDVAQLNARTEGWVAGLQLVALSAERQPNVARIIEARNPDVRVTARVERVSGETLPALSEAHDFILECSDNVETKFLVNDQCIEMKKPFCYCGVVGTTGQVMTYLPGHACFRCAFEEPNAAAVPTSRELGILGAAAGTLGALQAAETVKYLTGWGQLLTDAYIHVDLVTCTWEKHRVKRDKKCPCNKK